MKCASVVKKKVNVDIPESHRSCDFHHSDLITTAKLEYCLVCPTEQACDATQKADVAAVVMQEGLANLVLVTPAMTLLRAKVEVTIPRKRRGSCTQHEKVGRFSVAAREV